MRQNDAAGGDGDGVFEDVAQFADIAGPGVALEQVERLGRELQRARAASGAEEIGGERGDVAAAFAQRGHGDFEDVQPVVEIFAETPGAHFFAQVLVRRGDEPQIDAQVLASADAREGALFDEAQELGLDGGRDVGDFIEEKRAAAGALEVAFARGERAGEGAFFVAEELALEQLLGQRASSAA